jgi:hypothetical protein
LHGEEIEGACARPETPEKIGFADRINGRRSCTTGEWEFPMKKITVRKAGTVRLTSAAASAYCCGVA